MPENTLFNLNSHYGLIRMKGSDGMKFLQGLLTCDMEDLKTKDHCFGALCNLKGRVRALFRIFKKNDDLYLCIPQSLIPQILPVLKKHALFSKLSFEDVSHDYSILGFLGTPEDVLHPNTTAKIDPPTIFVIDEKISRFMLIVPKHAPLQNEDSFKKEDYDSWNLFNIRAGIPEIFKETTEKFLPHYLNLPELGAVSFTKGCYFGQEIIARMEYKGKIKYHLQHMIIEKNNPLFREFILGAELGPYFAAELQQKTVVNAATTPRGDVELLVI